MPSSHDLSLAAFTIDIAEFDFRHTQVGKPSGMLTTKLPLADTALICGSGGQSYFTRVFSRSVAAARGRGAGTTPMDNRRVSYAGLIISRA